MGFRPERLIDYIRFERQATSLALDPPLRFSGATAAAELPAAKGSTRHLLEREFDLTSEQILHIIACRTRLAVAVRGGVAEHHLERLFRADPAVAEVARLDQDAQHDFDVRLHDGRALRVECKNVAPSPFAKR